MTVVRLCCQFCGVSFGIARIRRADEPEHYAWNHWSMVDTRVDVLFEGDWCGSGSGCTIQYIFEEGDDPITLEERIGGTSGEHIAGPNCRSVLGYSGYRISYEEIKGCRDYQCLVKKDDDWRRESDDQEFEIQGEHFLSGTFEGLTYPNFRHVMPPRHGKGVILVYNYSSGGGGGASPPFHPTCFEIFKKVSIHHFGEIDVRGFLDWWRLDCTDEYFSKNFPRDPSVKTCYRDGKWYHNPGSEYLVANPIEIPGLKPFLQVGLPKWDTVVRKQIKNETPDVFATLPSELRDMILKFLGSKDLKNLMIASPTFAIVSTSIFRGFVFEDFPWLWEAKSLESRDTNWYLLHRKVSLFSNTLKGLRNRKRIWNEIEEIIKRIKHHRSQSR